MARVLPGGVCVWGNIPHHSPPAASGTSGGGGGEGGEGAGVGEVGEGEERAWGEVAVMAGGSHQFVLRLRYM